MSQGRLNASRNAGAWYNRSPDAISIPDLELVLPVFVIILIVLDASSSSENIKQGLDDENPRNLRTLRSDVYVIESFDGATKVEHYTFIFFCLSW